MWRCGGEALLHWDREGGATLHLLLPRLGSRLCLIAACVDNTAPGEVQVAIWAHDVRWQPAHMVRHERFMGVRKNWEGQWGMHSLLYPFLHLMSGKYPPLTDEFHGLSAALWEHLTFVNFCISIPNETAFSKTDDLFQITLNTSFGLFCVDKALLKSGPKLVMLWIAGRRHDNINKWAMG